MSTTLPARTISAYRRLAKPLAALMKVARGKAGGPVGAATIARCNRVIAMANRVFSREPDIGYIAPLPPGETLTLLDLTVLVDELTVAALRFEDHHPEIDPPG
jgi:hypothetical protein